MRRAPRMHVNLCAELRKAPRCAGMIEMDVTQKNMANVFCIKPGFPKIDNHVVESRFRSGIEQHDAVAGFERSRGDNFRVTKLPRVENVNQGRRMN